MIPISKPNIDKKEEKAVIEVLRSGLISQGKKVAELEKKFAKFIDVKYAVAVSSGTAALHLSLLAAGVKPDDEVILSPLTFIASANACFFVGAKPVFVDITADDFNINPQLIEAAINKKTRAIMPVHLYGAPANMKAINKIAKRYGLLVIEDACQAHGASLKNRKVGAWGLAGCFSFYATKNMIAGEGGIITTNNKKLANKCQTLRNPGLSSAYIHEFIGYNQRMSDIEAVIAIEQLKKLPWANNKRRKNALFLNKAIKTPGIILPKIISEQHHVFHQYTIRVTPSCPISRTQLEHKLKRHGIDYGIYYPKPIYKQKAYKKLGFCQKLPMVERIVKEVISLPVHPLVKQKDLNFMAKVINNSCQA